METINKTQTEVQMKNGNKFVKAEHYFFAGEGCFFPTKEAASLNFNAHNCTGVYFVEKVIDGIKWFQKLATNVWE
jgi:hypothetical protein